MARADDRPLYAKLRTAMIDAGCVYNGQPSARALAKRLAGPDANKDDIDVFRRQVRRWLDTNSRQETIRRDTAKRLSKALGVPVSYWPTERDQPGLNSRLAAAEAAVASVTRPLTPEEQETAKRLRDELEALLRRLQEASV